ncbi:MAG: DUF4093 domain-containing protein [Clostridia bacterium]|nr:DUF4093 domain-containing protein [Clostridia bacterium]
MIKLKQAVIVEGKYDKIKLSSIIDTLIIETDGFQIFKDKEKLGYIRLLAETRGVIIMTDSDSAGFLIRSHLVGSVKDGEIINVYIPDIKGREKRKEKDSADGLLGVEGMSEEVILSALCAAGVTADKIDKTEPTRRVTKADLYDDGLSGGKNSKELREKLLSELGLPKRISANAIPKALEYLVTYDQYKKAVDKIKKA